MLRNVRRRGQVFAISVVTKSMTANRNAAKLEMRKMYLFENVPLFPREVFVFETLC